MPPMAKPVSPDQFAYSAPYDFGTWYQGIGTSIGQIFFQDNWITGYIILVGIAINSRISAAMCLLGAVIGTFIAALFGGPEGAIRDGLFGYNAALTAIALGGFFLVFNWSSLLYAVFGAVVSAWLWASIAIFLKPIGMPVLIPEDYVNDLSVRLGLYRRLADIDEDREIDGFAAELADRFGPLPDEVQHLLKIVAIKALCRRANVEKIVAGPKGAVLQFRNNEFANPDGLVECIREEGKDARVRPDMKVVFFNDWDRPEQRLKGTNLILRTLVAIAEKKKAA